MKLNIILDLDHEYGNDDENLSNTIKYVINAEIESQIKKFIKNDPSFKANVTKHAKRIVEEFDANPTIFIADIKNKVSSAIMKRVIFENKEVQRQITKVIVDKVKNCQI